MCHRLRIYTIRKGAGERLSETFDVTHFGRTDDIEIMRALAASNCKPLSIELLGDLKVHAVRLRKAIIEAIKPSHGEDKDASATTYTRKTTIRISPADRLELGL